MGQLSLLERLAYWSGTLAAGTVWGGLASRFVFPRSDAAGGVWLRTLLYALVIAGPIMDAQGQSIGSVRVIEAPDHAAVDALTEGDPFAKAGCFARVSINPYRIVYKDGALAE